MPVTSSKRLALGGAVLLVGIASACNVLERGARQRTIHVGFWFEDVTYELPWLRTEGWGGAIDDREKQVIMAVARKEVLEAFHGLRVVVSESQKAQYRVRVVQEFAPTRWAYFGAAGHSWVVGPFRGMGAVNFLLLGRFAIRHAPRDADRAAIVEAIGRGIGRAAVHEFAHQMVPAVPIHASQDVQSYEYRSADRREQYYGPVRWDIARPLLHQRFLANDLTSRAPIESRR